MQEVGYKEGGVVDLRCENHSHQWVGCLGTDEEGLFLQVASKAWTAAVRKVLDEAVRYVPVDALPRPAKMQALEVRELGVGVDRRHYNVWTERRCLLNEATGL